MNLRYLLFSNVDIFYHFALDTPLITGNSEPTLFDFEDFDSKEIEYHHSTNGNLWDGYLSSSVRTSITLLRHIITYDRYLMRSIKETRYKDNFCVTKQYYDSLITGIENKMCRLHEVKEDVFDSMILDFEGIIDHPIC